MPSNRTAPPASGHLKLAQTDDVHGTSSEVAPEGTSGPGVLPNHDVGEALPTPGGQQGGRKKRGMRTEPKHPAERLSVNEYARLVRVSPAKVLNWIRTGELQAINICSPGSSRPIYRMSPEHIAAFEAGRSNRNQLSRRSVRHIETPARSFFPDELLNATTPPRKGGATA